MKYKFSLIICGYNEEDNIEGCIQSCLDLKYSKNKYEIIYVDNNSKDKTLELAKKYPIKILTEKKQGLSEARNCGIKNSNGEILVFLDADLKVHKDYLTYHEDTFYDRHIGAGGGKVLPLEKTWISNYLGVSLFEGYPRFKNNRYVNTYPGCNLTIKKDILDEVGYFQEGLLTEKGITRFAEDKEICERIRKKGYKILYNHEAIVYHKNTYLFKELLKIWIKGSKGRLNMIKLGKKDIFSLFFKYNLPIFGIFLFLLFLFLNSLISYILFLTYLVLLFILSIKSYIETGLFFQSFFIKPLMDTLSMIVINISVLYYKIKG